MGLAEDASVPLFGIVARLTAQKGIGLMRAALPQALNEMNLQLVVLGSGEAADEEFFRGLAERLSGPRGGGNRLLGRAVAPDPGRGRTSS